MKYTSLSHWNTGHNVQQNWNSVEEWKDYCKEDTSVVWSKLFTSVDGGFIVEYPERLQQYAAITGTNEYGLDMGYLTEKLNILMRDISSHTPSEAARVLARLSMVADEKVLSENEFVKQSPAVAVPDWYVVDRTDCDPKVFKREEDTLKFALASRSLIVAKETKVYPVFIGSPSPRITEQDALQIIKSWSGYFDQETFEMWWMAKGRAILDKLNGESK